MGCLLCSPIHCFSQSFDQGPVFSVIEENDLIVRTDRHYTQGIKLSYLSADNDVPRCVARFSDKIYALGFDVQATRFGIEIGQNIYTPSDISIDKPLPNDRPYAGWFYTGLVLQRRGLTTHRRIVTLENLQLDLGVIGPESLANESQSWVHEMRGFALPKGWRNQLKDEPGLALKYERSWRISTANESSWGVDLIPRIGASLGNVETSARISATVRAGWHLPDDFGPQTIDSLTTAEGGISKSAPDSSRYGVYVFAGAQGKAVGYTAFLDGNLFQHSIHVERDPFVAEFTTGIVLALNPVEFGVTYVYRTREFTHQTEHDGYGSIFIKARF
ncbi:MAG: hypothetical protein JWQ71_3649 [Pedosphaera sp.]|nr:hypothetical protein [Pedosphaera sp.]